MTPELPGNPELISANLRTVRDRIAHAVADAGRAPDAVRLIAVTKTVPAAIVRLVVAQGTTQCGENRVQEARAKANELALPQIQWELIGTLQRNKVSAAVGIFARIQSVDSLELAREIERVAALRDCIMPVLVQVNVAGESTKHGVSPAEALPLARAIADLPHLRGEGLMTVAPFAADPAEVRPVFAQLRVLRDQLQAEVGSHWRELSMGMTNDFPVAIAEGATLVRVGTAIFGTRA